MVPEKIDTYLFDLDGTLIDTKVYAAISAPVCEMVKKRFLLDDKSLERKAVGFGLKKNSAGRYDSGELCKAFGVLDAYYHILEYAVSKERNFLPVLQQLKKSGLRIGIVSNSMRKTIRMMIGDAPVDFIFSSEDAQSVKGKKLFWKRLIKKEHLVPSLCMMVGDDPVEDGKIPQSMGFHTLLVKDPKEIKRIQEKN